MSTPLALYHFTCSHGHDGITCTGVIRAHIHPFMRGLGPLVWLTDLPDPTGESVGFGGEFSICDHMAFCYVVRTKAAIPWTAIHTRAPRRVVEALEKFGQPDHWWIVRRSLTPSEFERRVSHAANVQNNDA